VADSKLKNTDLKITTHNNQNYGKNNINNSPLKIDTSILSSYLEKAIACLEKTNVNTSKEVKHLQSLNARLQEGQFHLAVLGQFKRGKSTFLNALIGKAILPSAVTPLTAIPTFIYYGSSNKLSIHYLNETQAPQKFQASWDELKEILKKYVTESGNPHNRLQVSHVEIFVPSPMLQKGVVLIDTPGIGSTFRHNTEVTHRFLPQCDAALFMLSSDPPITEVEVAFLKAVLSKVPKLFFIFNKIDYLEENDRKSSLAFLKKVLHEEVGIEDTVSLFSVSALQALKAQENNDKDKWEKSGFAKIENYLNHFIAFEKSITLQKALALKAIDIIDDSLMQLHLMMRSFTLPLSELEKKIDIFKEKINEARHQSLTAQDLLKGDKQRLTNYLEEEAEKLRQKAKSHLMSIVQEVISNSNSSLTDKAIQKVIDETVPSFFEKEFEEFCNLFDKRLNEIVYPHQKNAEEIIATVRNNTAQLFDIPYTSPQNIVTLKEKRSAYWITQKWSSSLSPLPPTLFDWMLPSRLRKQRLTKRISKQIDELVIYNVENLRWSILQGLNETFHNYTIKLKKRLDEISQTTQEAVIAASQKRAQESQTIDSEVAHINIIIEDLSKIRKAIKEIIE